MFAALIAPVCASMFFASGASAQAVVSTQPAVVAPARDLPRLRSPLDQRYQAVAGEAKRGLSRQRNRATGLTIRRATLVSISLAQQRARRELSVWTSSASAPCRALRTQRMRVTADLSAYDTLLDSIAFSRGRIAVTHGWGTAAGDAGLAEAARTLEIAELGCIQSCNEGREDSVLLVSKQRKE